MTPEQTPIAGKLRTTTQNNSDAKVLCERRKVAHAAARWAFENENTAAMDSYPIAMDSYQLIAPSIKTFDSYPQGRVR
jgi:hypothetical protein